MKKLLIILLASFLLCSCSGQNVNSAASDGTIISEAISETIEDTAASSSIELAEPTILTESEATYHLLMKNTDILNTDDVRGIVLLDLDFDGVPELIVSRGFTYKYQEEWGTGEMIDRDEILVNSDIYRIKNNELIFIDTLYNLDQLIYSNGNILGLKTLENGEKAWFNVSYKNRATDEWVVTDYLFTLDGDKLNFTEVFSRDGVGLQNLENASYNYFGKPLTFEVKHHNDVHIDCDCDPLTTGYYSEWYDCLYYKDNYVDFSFEGIFGKGEIFEKFKAAWCEDMSKSVINLHSDWLIQGQNHNLNIKDEVTEEELSVNIKQLTNDFYNGKNQFIEFTYYFLGDYAKPVIYLYPETETDVSVTLELNGELTCTYPNYDRGWNVTAYSDGALINKTDGREYSYLYWEGKGSVNWDFSSGFVVKSEDTVMFLQEKLEFLGLKPREYNEFITYWLPLMQGNEYNLITFQTTVYEQNAKLYVSPKPDSVLRVFMAYMPLNNPINIAEPSLKSFERKGFSVIEWGGTCVE